MIKVTVDVLASEDLNDTREWRTLELAGVPRVGETVVAQGTTFTVKAVAWSDTDGNVTITVENDTYGYNFPTGAGSV